LINNIKYIFKTNKNTPYTTIKIKVIQIIAKDKKCVYRAKKKGMIKNE